MNFDTILVPYDKISNKSLEELIISFIQREGTDYGMSEISIKTKIQNLKTALKKKTIYIVFSAELDSFNLITKEEAKLNQLI